MDKPYRKLVLVLVVIASLGIAQTIHAQFRARDPGVRGGAAAGGPIAGLTTDEREMFDVGQLDFS
jgi:hypothetical protein